MAKVIQYRMGYLENICVRDNLSNSTIASRFGLKMAEPLTNLVDDEKDILRLFIKGYYLIQKAGEFVDYQKLPYWKFLRLIPPVPSVVSAACLSERIGREIIDECLDYEHILKMGGKISGKSIRNLGNILSGVMANVEDGKITDKTYNKIKSDLKEIVYNWGNRPENKIL